MSIPMTLEEKRKKFGVGIWTVLDFLNIEIPDRDNFYIPCQNCGGGSGRKTLNVNIVKETFRCPRCDISGGYLDLFSLYYYGKIQNNYTKKDMMRDLKNSNFDYNKIKQSNNNFADFKIEPEIPLLSIEKRDVVYKELLNNSVLSNKDLNDLRRRGLTDKAIKMLGYKSTTLMGKETALNLRQRGFPLKGVPGFYREDSGSQWNIVNIPGYYIPYRDTNGFIQGMQIRTCDKKRKYMWLSSRSQKDGSGAKTWPHFAQTFTSSNHFNKQGKTFILTEGGLKGDIINFYTGIDVVAIPGVNTLSQLEPMLIDLKNMGYTKVLTAFDMDFLSNKYVLAAYNKLIEFITGYFDIFVLKWDSNYKGRDTNGLDDYLQAMSEDVDFFEERKYLLY